jgi:multidrug efflux pump subunit AcrA (membrane-fusion protein)
MFAEGKILTGIQKSAIVIPTACVYRDDRGTGEGSVFIVENGVAVRRKLNLGREYNGSVEVLAGLHENEVLIAEQSLELAEGVRVQTHEGEHAPQ